MCESFQLPPLHNSQRFSPLQRPLPTFFFKPSFPPFYFKITQYKVVLLGEGRVGKTSCVLRYCRGIFSDDQEPTLQASYLAKRLRLGDRTISLNIWDTAGQERYDSLGPLYYRDAKGACLVYDITDPSTFQKVQKWVNELRTELGAQVPIIILGNKCDLEKNRAVVKDTVLKYAQSVGATHYDTSAKVGKGLDEAFIGLARKLVENESNSVSKVGTMRRNASIRVVNIEPTVDENNKNSTSTSQSQPKPGCCG